MRLVLALLVLALLVLADLGAASPGARADSRSSTLVWIADRPTLGAVLRRIDQRYPGRALAAYTLERNGRALYQIKWLGNDGKVRDITCDARTGEILRVH
jgi:uncharacterized iron-regulated membrane protein